MNHLHLLSHRAHGLSVISRSKAGALNHLGILLPDGRVAHCSPGRGEHVSSIEDFSMARDVTILEVVDRHLHRGTFERIAACMRSPQAYHATTNNCEMFVNRMLGRNPTSPQLSAALVLVAFAVIGMAAAA